jgi:DNA-binding transcriptional LysR family regulator
VDAHRLKVFASVYRNRSFSRASDELRLSQPTVSEHVKALEESLGVRLFDRLGRGIAPTSEAALLYPRAMEVLEKMESIREAVRLSSEHPAGEVLAGASTIPGTYIIPRAAADFRSRYPNISFTVLIEDSARIARMVAEQELLLGFVGARMSERGLRYEPFVEDRLCLAMRRDLAPKGPVKLDALMELPFILREEGSGTRKTLEHHLREHGTSTGALKVSATLGSTASVKEALKAGLGVSVLSWIAVKEELRDGSLKEIKVRELDMVRNFYIITRRGRTIPRAYHLFLEHLRMPFSGRGTGGRQSRRERPP